MDIVLLKLLVALCVNEFLHNSFEIWGIRQKVQWLDARMHDKKHGTWPININTELKAYSLHAGLFIGITGAAFIILLALPLSARQLLIGGIILLSLSYGWTTNRVHYFHLEIGKLLRKFKQL